MSHRNYLQLEFVDVGKPNRRDDCSVTACQAGLERSTLCSVTSASSTFSARKLAGAFLFREILDTLSGAVDRFRRARSSKFSPTRGFFSLALLRPVGKRVVAIRTRKRELLVGTWS